MKDLIVVQFQGKHRASEALVELQALDNDWAIALSDAVAVYRTDDGKLRMDKSAQPTGKQGRVWGGLIGGILGAIVAAPFPAGASTAVAAAAVSAGVLGMGAVGAATGDDDASNWKAAYGVSDDFVKEVAGAIPPGASALFAVIESDDPIAVAEKFRGSGGKVLRTRLSSASAQKVQDIIGDHRTAK